MPNIRTDLALEAYSLLSEDSAKLSGITAETENEPLFRTTRVRIETEEAAKRMGKAVGNYITLEIPQLCSLTGEDFETVCLALSRELRRLLRLQKSDTALIAGLGNRYITSDALGPQVVENLMITRHLFSHLPDLKTDGLRPVCAVSPGVLGITGMETGEILRGIVAETAPDFMIAVDALAARSMDRISTTIQLCDTGIAPGAGVGNRRKALNLETLGIPVFAIGVPTVIDAAAISADTLNAVTDSLLAASEKNSELYRMLRSLDREEQFLMAKEALSPHMADFIVTPKDVDQLIGKVAKAVAGGINLALHDDIDFSVMESFVS